MCVSKWEENETFPISIQVASFQKNRIKSIRKFAKSNCKDQTKHCEQGKKKQKVTKTTWRVDLWKITWCLQHVQVKILAWVRVVTNISSSKEIEVRNLWVYQSLVASPGHKQNFACFSIVLLIRRPLLCSDSLQPVYVRLGESVTSPGQPSCFSVPPTGICLPALQYQLCLYWLKYWYKRLVTNKISFYSNTSVVPLPP